MCVLRLCSTSVSTHVDIYKDRMTEHPLSSFLPDLSQLADIDFSNPTHLIALNTLEEDERRKVDIEINGAFFSPPHHW